MSGKQKLAAIWGWLRGTRARVLLYHSISDAPAAPLAVSVDQFHRQMLWLAQNGFRVISSSDLEVAIRQGLNLHRTVVLTFDDGVSDFFQTAAPILRRLGFTATVFVPTGKIGQTIHWSGQSVPVPLMSADQLAQIVEMGFEVGSHTVNHVSLPSADENALEYELEASLRKVQRITGGERVAFAYPFGHAGHRERIAVMRAGYSTAYLGGGLWGNGADSDLFALTREPIVDKTLLPEFIAVVRGRYDLVRLGADIRQRGFVPGAY